MHKKGQIEMIGLVVVVIILAIGLLLYVKLSFREEPVKEDITIENARVTNLMGAVFNVKVCESDPKRVDEALVMCFENKHFCGETEVCDYVKGQIKEITGFVSLKNYNKYSIWIEKGSNKIEIIKECETGILTHTTIVTSNNEHYTAYFRVC